MLVQVPCFLLRDFPFSVLLQRIVVGSKKYFKNNPLPKTPQDLEKHNCIVHTKSFPQDEWLFFKQNSSTKVQVSGNFKVDNFTGLRSAILADLGIGYIGSLLFDNRALQQLQIILTEFEPAPLPINILYPEGRNLPSRVRIFIDFIKEELSKEAWVLSRPNKN